MTSSGLLVGLLVIVVHLTTCHVVDVEYREKVVSDRKSDGFGKSLATSHHKLVIGAPFDNNDRGLVIVDEGVRVTGPAGGWNFGRYVDVNQQFMVVSGAHPFSVYVYQSNSPYDMVARLPIDGWVDSVVISDDNTIAVSHDNMLTIYQYDGSSTWNIAQKFQLESRGDSLAMYRDIIVVGVAANSLVRIFNRAGGEWVQGQTIRQLVGMFSYSVAVYGQHIAVSSSADRAVFTYMLDQHTNTWINN